VVEKDDSSAGSATWHTTHAHYHYQNAYEIQLLKVKKGDCPTGTKELSPSHPHLCLVGPGRKRGFDPTNERMADWHRFWPACGVLRLPTPDEIVAGIDPNARCQHDRDFRGGGFIEVQAGWGDIYEWNRGGNYVAFPEVEGSPGKPVAGSYVLRATADPLGKIIETDETDNVSYARIQVFEDEQVVLLERGYGSDPWDPSKKVLKVTP
jgi:hypothetical protein